MRPFELVQATKVPQALASSDNGAFVAGGTTLIDLMKLNVETPSRVIDINRLPLNQIEVQTDGGISVGALVRNSDLAHHPAIPLHYTVLSLALRAGASAQLRNMATTGGNLLQRTDALISGMPRCRATSASPAAAVRRSKGLTGH